jgi:hypothetical protein
MSNERGGAYLIKELSFDTTKATYLFQTAKPFRDYFHRITDY